MVELVTNSLVRCCEEMRVTVERTAYSTIISETVDFSCALLDTDKNLVAEASGIPVFLANLSEAVSEVDRIIGFENLEEGDVIFCNDPYSGGFSHNPDVTVIAPVFYEGHLVLFSAFKGHILDLGGIYAGGWYNNTVETYQEGVMFPPVKLYIRGEPNEDIIRVIRRNSRLPEALLGDIRAMVSAVRVGGERAKALIKKYGKEAFFGCVGQALEISEAIARKAVEAIPDGVYSGHYYSDGGGDDTKPLSDRLMVKMTITVDGDRLVVDLTGSSPQCAGPTNCPRPTTVSQIRYGFKALTTPFMPSNEGCFRPLEIIIPEASIFDPLMPTATSLLWAPSVSLPDLMLKLVTSQAPDKARAGHFGDVCADFLYGTDPRTGRFYIYAEPTAGGWGAKPYEDGETMFCYADGNTYSMPVEVLEVKYPVRVLRYGLSPDTGGPGRYRGGLGIFRDYSPVGHTMRTTVTFDRRKYSPAWGVFGGKEGYPNKVVVLRNDSSEEYGKITDLEVHSGEVISLRGGGGGGYGDPMERDPRAVAWDVLNEYISLEAARREYGVVLDPSSLEVDEGETAALRGPGKGAEQR
jgi:N-methylhydantoinase B